MPDYKIEIPGLVKFRDRLDIAIMQLTAQKLYDSIKEKIPEIEIEESKVIFDSAGRNLVLNSINLSAQLQYKLENFRFSYEPVIGFTCHR